jgi:xanthine dehydrogenase accessory factor
MHTADEEVLQVAADWIDSGRRVILATVARTWGSSPRPVGAMAAVRDDGLLAGSVSGGCVEDDLAERVRAGADLPELPGLLRYGVTAEQTHRFGLPCGGQLQLVVERLEHASALRRILDTVARRERIARRVCLDTGEASLHAPGADQQEFDFDGHNAVKVFGPAWRLLVIGAGQLSRFLAEMALALDYQVVVCDPRAEYAAAWQVPGAELDARMPDDAVRALASDARSAVIALTHDPKLDDLALLEALGSQAFYVGALGSQANNDRRRARLGELGITPAELGRLHGPVGLPIGSRTPGEIAVSILAGLTAARRGVALGPMSAAEPD